MYRFSRSIYRELVPSVTADRLSSGAQNRQRVLDACEAAVRRIAYDRRYFAHPARTLFNDIRVYLPLTEQSRAYRVIERNLDLAAEFIAQLPGEGLALDGRPMQCRATTRRGKPCQRQPLPGSEYCPSHKHLRETFEEVGVAA